MTTNFISIDVLDSFFRHIYPLPSYSFLHFKTLRQKCLDGILDEALALAIRGIVALQHPSHETSASEGDGSSFIEHAESLVFRQIENASMPRLQAMVLVMRHRIETKRYQRAFMLAGIAARFATALHLNDERYDLDAVPQEVRRRTMWSFKLLETYFSIGLEYELWPFENIYLKYPCREMDFGSPGMPPNSVLLAPNQHMTDDFGAYSCCVRLISLRRDIMKLNRSVSICNTEMPELPQLVVEIEEALSKAKMHMLDPDFVALVNSNDRWLPRHVMMFACWHQCHCDLYRLFLQGYSDSAPQAVLSGFDQSYLTKAEELCTTHAKHIVQMLAELNLNSVKRLTLEYDTAICAYQATRMILFLASYGKRDDRPTYDFAVSRAELCLASLNRFFSPIMVKPIIEGIQQILRTLTSPHSSDESEIDVCLDIRVRKEPSQPPSRSEPSSRLSWAAQTKNRLAIHSLLRQADFPGDEDKDNGND
ncbi:hypothetical protein BDV96DRAFT_643669 [Lophiotrema nucula]|uniref:Xylanolytic transcriptional activator regulatory domain-containing protein n=1 Tax=Lophiotrema nucula TaxID=690887 RepID=A0A6A5ZHR4_9PLEO|nr:hypothetical protein BDV96DRAFT_643669 [Lophiotrema nucula]